MQLPRKKVKSRLLGALYHALFGRLSGLISAERKLRFFLDMSWIFERLAFAASYEYYPTLSHPARLETQRFIKNRIDGSFRILDLGCGLGHYSALLAEIAQSVVGVDHNASNIAKARARYPQENIQFISGDAWEYLERSGEEFDVLFLAHVLEHLDEPAALLRKFSARFRHIYVEVPDFDGMLIQAIRHDIGTPFIYTDEDHVNEFGRDELLAIIADAGLVVDTAQYKRGIQYLWLSRPE